MAAPEKNAVPDASTDAKPGNKLRAVKIVAIVLMISLSQLLAAYLFFPSSKDTQARAGAIIEAELPDIKKETDSDDSGVETAEVDLKEFRVTAFQPLSSTVLRIDFHLWGTVKVTDQEEFSKAWESKEKRIRDQIIVTIRSADLNDFTDAGLGLIKRRILETTNKTLGKSLLRGVMFSEFSFIEQ